MAFSKFQVNIMPLLNIVIKLYIMSLWSKFLHFDQHLSILPYNLRLFSPCTFFVDISLILSNSRQRRTSWIQQNQWQIQEFTCDATIVEELSPKFYQKGILHLAVPVCNKVLMSNILIFSSLVNSCHSIYHLINTIK